MTGCSIAAKRMGNDLITGKKKIADISSEMKTATASTKALGVAMNIFANVGFMLAIAAITKVVSELAQAQKNATQAAKEATETYKDEISSINDYKTKLSELHEELNSGNLSYEETKTKRTELMSIQDELIEKFGTEKGAIESVTKAINGQVDALDSLNEKSYRDWISKADNQTVWNKLLPWGKSGLDQAVDYMETSQTVSFNDMQNANLSEELQAIQKEIDETIRKKYNLDKSLATFNVTGTPDEIKSQLENIRQDYLDLSKNAFLENGISSEVWEEYRKEAIESINEVINKFDEGLEKHQETYQTYIEGMIKYDSEYSDEYATILQKRASLESAENSGNADNIQKARQEFMDAINNGIQASGSDKNIKKYFESLYPELQAEFDSWNFEVAINANTDGLADKAKEIGENFTAVDLLNMVNTDGIQEGEESFNKLIDKAIEYGVCTDNSAEEVQKLIDLLVKLGIVQGEVQGSTLNNETDILSFSDAWNSEDFEDARKELLSLAEAGQLTPETLQSTEEYKTLLEQTGLSAEEAAKKINSMTDASTQLQSMSAQISKMSDMLADKKNGTTASASDLAGFDATVKGLESWDEFERVMGSSKSSMEECQAAANALATEWINNGNYLANLTEENKDYYITQLNNMGIENADAIVTDTLSAKKIAEKYAIEDLSDATRDEISVKYQEIAALIKEGEVSGTTASALYDLIYQQTIFSNQNLDVYGKISALQELALAFGVTADAALGASQAINLENQLRLAKHYGATDTQVEAYATQLTSKVQDGIKAKFVNLSTSISPTGSKDYKKSGSTDKKGSDTKQTIDWISRLLDVLQKKIDATKAKFDNLFTLKDKKNNLAEQITLTKGLLTATTVAADRYKKAADKVGLSKELKTKVKNGSYDITEYGSETAEKIQKYQDYIDQYNELKQQEEELNAEIRGLKSDKYQLDIDNAENNIAKLDAQMDNSSSYKERIKHLKEERDYIKDSYYYQIKQAELNGELVKADELRAKRQKELTDNTIAQYEETANNAQSKLAKSQAYAELDAGNYKEQNKHLEKQKQYTRDYYNAQIKIAKKKGDLIETDRLRAEKQKELNDLSKQEFDNISNTYDNKLQLLNAKAQSINNQIGIIEAKGYVVSEDYYNSLMTNTKKNLSELSNELVTLRQKRDEMLKDGTLKKGSDDWYAIQNAIWAVKNAQDDATKSLAEYEKQIRQLKWDAFDRQEDFISKIQDEGNFLIDLMSNEKLFYDDFQTELKEYQKGGNVNLFLRPQIDSSELNKIGWDAGNGISTVFTSTYSNEDGTIALNFTPIIADPKTGEYIGALSPSELQSYAESVIAGTREDDLNLQIGSSFNGSNAIDQAVKAAEEIHELQQKYYLESESSGNWTEYANAIAGLRAMNYNAYMAQADDYEKEIQAIQQEINNDPYNIDLIQRKQELISTQRELIKSAEQEKESIKALVSDGYNKWLDALQKSIDLRKKELDSVSDLYSYQKNIAKLAKETANYEKQWLALQGDDSEENKATLQKVTVALQDSRDALQESEYEQWKRDQESMLDALADDAQEWVNQRLDNIDGLISDVITATNTNSDSIRNTLDKVASEVGITLSSDMSKIWDATDGISSVVSDYGDKLSGGITTVGNTLTSIKDYVAKISNASDKPSDTSTDDGNFNPKQYSQKQQVLEFIDFHKKEATRERDYYKALNQYIYDATGGYVLSKTDEAALANLLDVNVYSDLTGDAGRVDLERILAALKLTGFSEGGTIGKAIKQSGESGFILARTGEEVLSLEKIDKLKETLKLANPTPSIKPFEPFNVPVRTQNIGNNIDKVQMEINLPGVTNYEEFKSNLIKDRQFEKVIQTMTLGNALGGNTLNKYRIR